MEHEITDYYAAKIEPDAILPTRDLETNCGWDLYAHRFETEDYRDPNKILTSDEVTLRPGEICKIYTGCAMSLPKDYGAFFWDRSGNGSRGVHRLAGVIDWSYRGELIICVIYLGRRDFTIKKGDRPAQMIIQHVPPLKQIEISFEELSKLSSARGEKGFGSSGD